MDSARDHARSLERIERAKGSTVEVARRRTARRLRVGSGTFENIIRGRVKRVDAWLRDRLQALLVQELEAEIARLEHELQMVRQSGSHLASDQVREIETHLAAARSLIEGTRSSA
jgi:hypothetical protein